MQIFSFFNIDARTSENTVVTEYTPVASRSDAYQSEAALEKEFIEMLTEQGHAYLSNNGEKGLIENLRLNPEELNHVHFSDGEWERFFTQSIANQNESIVEKTGKIQEDHVQVLKRDDGTSKNITLIDKKNIHNNRLQVINQYKVSQGDGRFYPNLLCKAYPPQHPDQILCLHGRKHAHKD